MVIDTVQVSGMFWPWRFAIIPAGIVIVPGSPVTGPCTSPMQSPIAFHAIASAYADGDHDSASGAAREAVAGTVPSVNFAGSVATDKGAPASTERWNLIVNAAPSISVENSA